jgi:hypothetical protein
MARENVEPRITFCVGEDHPNGALDCRFAIQVRRALPEHGQSGGDNRMRSQLITARFYGIVPHWSLAGRGGRLLREPTPGGKGQSGDWESDLTRLSRLRPVAPARCSEAPHVPPTGCSGELTCVRESPSPGAPCPEKGGVTRSPAGNCDDPGARGLNRLGRPRPEYAR